MKKRREKEDETCYALEACNEDQLIDIFEESFGYLSFTQTYVDRMMKREETIDSASAPERPLVILDIDNTLLYCRYFADEICVSDSIAYCLNGVDETSGTVISVWYRINLQLFDDDIIDEYGTDLIEYDHCHTLPQRLKKKKTFHYPYKIDEESNEILESREGLIKGLRVIACEIEYGNNHHKLISFEEDSTEIQHFVPSLSRKGYDDAAFIYDGFIVRLRYGLEDFIEGIAASFDIVLFTAASRSLYQGLTTKLHEYLCDIMGRDSDDETDQLWKHILFREDCEYDFDENGKLFHHKDITKFNRELSKVIIVDNSALAFKSFEPNAILITDYMGKDKMDNELEAVLTKLDDIVDIEQEDTDKYIDYRYILCGMHHQIPSDLDQYDRKSPHDILESTQRFLNDLKQSLIQRQLLPNTLKFPEAVSGPTHVTPSDASYARGMHYTSIKVTQHDLDNAIDSNSRVRTEIRNNASDDAEKHVFSVEGQVSAWIAVVKNIFGDVLSNEQDVIDTVAFLYWDAWLSAAAIPDDTCSHTHHWSHEPLAGNEATPAVILWSIASALVLFVGLMITLYLWGPFAHDKGDTNQKAKPFTTQHLDSGVIRSTQVLCSAFFVLTIIAFATQPSALLQNKGRTFLQRILTYVESKTGQNDKKINDVEKRHERPVPPAPPETISKRIDNPSRWNGVVNGGTVMNKAHHKPPPPPPKAEAPLKTFATGPGPPNRVIDCSKFRNGCCVFNDLVDSGIFDILSHW